MESIYEGRHTGLVLYNSVMLCNATLGPHYQGVVLHYRGVKAYMYGEGIDIRDTIHGDIDYVLGCPTMGGLSKWNVYVGLCEQAFYDASL